MPRVKNKTTGVVIDVPDEQAKRLGKDWAPVEAPKPRGRSRKSETGGE